MESTQSNPLPQHRICKYCSVEVQRESNGYRHPLVDPTVNECKLPGVLLALDETLAGRLFGGFGVASVTKDASGEHAAIGANGTARPVAWEAGELEWRFAAVERRVTVLEGKQTVPPAQDSAEDQMRCYADELRVADAQIATMRDEMQQLKSEASALANANRMLTNDIEMLHADLRRLTVEVLTGGALIATLTRERDTLTRERDALAREWNAALDSRAIERDPGPALDEYGHPIGRRWGLTSRREYSGGHPVLTARQICRCEPGAPPCVDADGNEIEAPTPVPAAGSFGAPTAEALAALEPAVALTGPVPIHVPISAALAALPPELPADRGVPVEGKPGILTSPPGYQPHICLQRGVMVYLRAQRVCAVCEQ